MADWRLCNLVYCLAKKPACVWSRDQETVVSLLPSDGSGTDVLRGRLVIDDNHCAVWTFKDDYHDSCLETMWNFLPIIDDSGKTPQSVKDNCTPCCLSFTVANCNVLVCKATSSSATAVLLKVIASPKNISTDANPGSRSPNRFCDLLRRRGKFIIACLLILRLTQTLVAATPQGCFASYKVNYTG